MPTARPRLIRRLALLALPSIVVAFATPDVKAQDGYGPLQRYSLRWYGQNFYDHQYNGIGTPRFGQRQYHGNYYGPAMMYGRQYSDMYGYTRPRPFAQKQGLSPVEASFPRY